MRPPLARVLCFAAAFLVASPVVGDWPTVATASARKKRKKKTKAKPKPKPAPTPPAQAAPATVETVEATSVQPAAPAAPASGETQKMLERAKKLYAELEYADVIPLAVAVLAREDATIEQRLDAYLLQGSSLAIVGNPVDAEKPFRFLLRGRPDFDMPPETPPKIMAVFRKVQVEERAIVDQMAELRRKRIIEELELETGDELEGQGGLPLEFEYTLRDPGRAVDGMSVHYRRAPSDPYSALALQIDDDGAWRAQIPGEWTENDDGFTLQYYVTTADAEGVPLLNLGGPGDPLGVAVAPGSVADARPIYKAWWFWAASAGVAVLIGAGSYLLYDQATALPETDGRIDL